MALVENLMIKHRKAGADLTYLSETLLQQRVAIARALANRPRVVLMDEPTGNLDQENSRAITQLVRSVIRDDPVTFIIATHNLEIVQETPSRLFLKAGRVVAEFISHS